MGSGKRNLIALGSVALAATLLASAQAAPVDPRANGLEIALGEWTLIAEATAIRPGSVTFVVANRGRFDHGFRIRQDRDGGKGGDRFEARTAMLRPGQTARLTVDLAAGVYEIDCFVEGHDDRGMEGLLEVRADAPFVEPPKPAAKTLVTIQGFAYKPAKLTIKAGQTARWVNKDAAPHTVTAKSGAWTSKQLGRGGTFAKKLTRAGAYPYICALHPQMKGTVVVTR